MMPGSALAVAIQSLAGTGIVVILRRKAVRKMIGRIEIMCLSSSDQRRVRQKEYREIKLVRRIHVIVLFGLAAALAGFGCDQQIQQQPSQVNETKTSEQGPILPGKTGSEKGPGFCSCFIADCPHIMPQVQTGWLFNRGASPILIWINLIQLGI